MTQHEHGTIKLVHLEDSDVVIVKDQEGNRLELYTDKHDPRQNQAQIFQKDMQSVRTDPKAAQQLVARLESAIALPPTNLLTLAAEFMGKSKLTTVLESGAAVHVNPTEIGKLIPPELRYATPGFDPRKVAEPKGR